MTTGHLQNSLGIYALAKDGNGAADFHDKYFRISPTRGVRIPFDLSAISSRAAPQEPHIPLSTAQINSTMKCVNSAHAILDTFLGMSINVMRQVPGVLYVRATNAIQTLMNIALTAIESDLGEYMDITSLLLMTLNGVQRSQPVLSTVLEGTRFPILIPALETTSQLPHCCKTATHQAMKINCDHQPHFLEI
jgi:hypothetical protein